MIGHERLVQGYCPMGCGETLFVSQSGRIRCNVNGCPRPLAVDELLADRETEHVVELRDEDFTIRHPLAERLDDALFRCQLNGQLSALDGPPAEPGRYRLRPRGTGRWGWSWEQINGEDTPT